jgi:hypothetical protein
LSFSDPQSSLKVEVEVEVEAEGGGAHDTRLSIGVVSTMNDHVRMFGRELCMMAQ